MHIGMRTFFLSASLLAWASCYAQDVFGLRIGEPLVLTECRRIEMPKVPGYVAPYAKVFSPCLKDLRRQADGSVVGLIAFPADSPPMHATGNELLFSAEGGLLELIQLTTGGAPVQSAVLEDLRAKFGTPTSIATVPLVNAAGAAFHSTVATWRTSTLQVEFVGASSRFDAGTLTIATPAGMARHASRTSAPSSARPL